MSVLSLAKALSEHAVFGWYDTGGKPILCRCGEAFEARAYTAHVADTLAPLIEQWIGAAEQAAYDEGRTEVMDMMTGKVEHARRDGAAAVAARFRVAAELVVQDVRAQRGDHIAGLVEDSFAAHFDRAAALTSGPAPCRTCDGVGERYGDHPTGDPALQYRDTCTDCGGTGEAVDRG